MNENAAIEALEQVKEEAARFFKLADEAYIRSKIPDKPEYEKVEKIVKDIVYDYIKLVEIKGELL